MDPVVPLPLEAKQLEDLVEKAKDYALMHGKNTVTNIEYLPMGTSSFAGICMRQKDKFDRDALHFAPFLLFPSPFPDKEFKRATDIQVYFLHEYCTT